MMHFIYKGVINLFKSKQITNNMEVSKEARKIILEATKQKGIEDKIILTNKNIYELARKNVVDIEFFWNKNELIQKIIDLASEKKKTGFTKPLILSEQWYIDVPDQNDLNKSVENYHKLNSSTYFFKILEANFSKSNNETIKKYLKYHSNLPSIALMQATKITPKDAIKQIGKTITSEEPKIGYAFKTFQKSIIAVTWKNLGEGFKRFQNKTYEIEFQDKKIYAGIVNATIKNNESDSIYKATIKSAFINPKKGKDTYRYLWTPEIITTSEDYNYKGDTQKQKASFQFGTKDLVTLLHAAHNFYGESKDPETLGVYSMPNKFFPEPNQSYMNLLETINKLLVIKASTDEPKKRIILKANETMENQLLDAVIQKYGASKFF